MVICKQCADLEEECLACQEVRLSLIRAEIEDIVERTASWSVSVKREGHQYKGIFKLHSYRGSVLHSAACVDYCDTEWEAGCAALDLGFALDIVDKE